MFLNKDLAVYDYFNGNPLKNPEIIFSDYERLTDHTNYKQAIQSGKLNLMQMTKSSSDNTSVLFGLGDVY